MVIPPDEPNERASLEELTEDSRGDFSERSWQDDISSRPVDDTHPITDTNDLQYQELYDAGLSGIAREPNAGNAVVSYDPEKDQRLNKKKPS